VKNLFHILVIKTEKEETTWERGRLVDSMKLYLKRAGM
jgi:hypothetical protein